MVDKNGNSGIYCPACDKRLGISDSTPQLVRAQHTRTTGGQMVVKCQVCGSSYDYERLIALRPRMVQVKIVEKQPANTIPLTIWVYPEPLEALRQRFPQNFMTTMTAMFTAVADPDTVMIEGEHGRALKASGVLRGRDVEGLGVLIKQLESDLAQAKVREEAFAPMFAMMEMMKQGGVQQAGAPGGFTMPVRPAATAASLDPRTAADYHEEFDPLTAADPSAWPGEQHDPNDQFAAAALPSQAVARPSDLQPGETATRGIPKPVAGGR